MSKVGKIEHHLSLKFPHGLEKYIVCTSINVYCLMNECFTSVAQGIHTNLLKNLFGVITLQNKVYHFGQLLLPKH